jgi:hypothetical protein
MRKARKEFLEMKDKQPPVREKKNPPEALHRALKNHSAVSATIRLADGSNHCWDGMEFKPC